MSEITEKRARGRPLDYPDEGPMQVMSMRITQALRDKLTREAKRRGMSRNDLVLEKLSRWCDSKDSPASPSRDAH